MKAKQNLFKIVSLTILSLILLNGCATSKSTPFPPTEAFVVDTLNNTDLPWTLDEVTADLDYSYIYIDDSNGNRFGSDSFMTEEGFKYINISVFAENESPISIDSDAFKEIVKFHCSLYGIEGESNKLYEAFMEHVKQSDEGTVTAQGTNIWERETEDYYMGIVFTVDESNKDLKVFNTLAIASAKEQ